MDGGGATNDLLTAAGDGEVGDDATTEDRGAAAGDRDGIGAARQGNRVNFSR
jgi:hypothetical protein